MKFWILALLLSVLSAPQAMACGPYGLEIDSQSKVESLITVAVSDYVPAAQKQKAISLLRERGQQGLDALMSRLPKGKANISKRHLENLKQVIDQVAMQRDAHASGLYWYTDFDKARAQAQKEDKPILSLRLLGNLNEEYSCANSRFFRTALYADKEMSAYLKENFVLHWKSVRKIPVITIDLGDGKVIRRTITGNSMHHILDKQGRLFDTLPGLYASKPFRNHLSKAADYLKNKTDSKDDETFFSLRQQFHKNSMATLAAQFQNDLKAIGYKSLSRDSTEASAKKPDAAKASERSVSKMKIEKPLLRSLEEPSETMFDEVVIDQGLIQRLAMLEHHRVILNGGSKALMRQKNPELLAKKASQTSVIKGEAEATLFDVMEARFERGLAQDSVMNEYVFHRQILQMLIDNEFDYFAGNEVEVATQTIYAKLFLTPLDDPWMGLSDYQNYDALEHNGGLLSD